MFYIFIFYFIYYYLYSFIIFLKLICIIIICRISLSHVSFRTSVRIYLVSRFSYVLLRRFVVRAGWLRIVAHTLLIVFAAAFVRQRFILLIFELSIYSRPLTQFSVPTTIALPCTIPYS